MSSQILRHLKNDFDILFLQEINHAPILPHVYAYGSGTKATIVSNISQDKHSRGEHGSVLVCSPRLSRFVTPLPRLDTEGMLAAAVLTLPGAPPTLLVSVYAPSTDVHRSKIENILRPLMHQYPNHVLGGDTNCIMCPELDGSNLQTDNEWPWLRRQITSDPPRLIDTFRHFHPTERSFSRYPTPYRASSSRLDHILLSPAASEFFAPTSATIQTDDKTSDHHPVTYTSQVPPHPFTEAPTTKRKVFRKLTERERSKHHDSLAPLARWCESTLPRFESLSSADIELFTDVVLEEVATSYHSITTPSRPTSSALVKKIKESLQTLPPPSHPNYPASMDTLNKLVKEWETKVNKAATTKIHRCLVRKTRIKRTINEALNPVERGEITLKRPGTTQLVSTPKEVGSIFSSTLLTLGGSLEYAPPNTLVDRLLAHSPACPEPTKHGLLPDITWESLRNTLKRSKPNKAGGRDFTNNYTLHVSPPPIQQFIWKVCNYYLHRPLPEKWLEANIILLFKKGDVMNPVNYRPIALLNSVYKIIATHANRELLAAAIEHSIIHPTQFGGLPNRRCQDHIFNLLSTFRESVGSYSLYIDFNKAFNSVPHTTLFTVLSRLNFPTPLVNLIQSLYRAPRDFPVVSGQTHSSHLQTRGVRQGCPMSPILFCLYLNVLLFALPSHVTAPPSPHESGHAFVDDLLYRSENGDRIQQVLNFFDTVAREWGLDLNLSKTEIHAMGTAPPRTFTSPSGTPLSTTNQKTGQPHNCYKYLGVYIFTTNHEAQTLALAKSEIRSFFTTLQPLQLTLSEYILLVNVQLIPILSYRLMAHPLALNELGALQAMIWQNVAHDPSPDRANRISRLVSPKARYTPRHQGGLGLRHFTFSICMALVNTAIRYLNGDGPASTNESFSEAMLSTTRNPIQDTIMDACHAIGFRYHSTGLWASCPPSLFLPKEKVQVRFLATKPAPQYSKFGNRLKRTPQDLGFHLGTVTEVHSESATLQFSDGTTHTIKNPGLRRNEKEYTFQNPAISVLPQLAGRHELLTPPLLHPQEYILNPPPGPYGGVLLDSSLHGELYRLPDEPHSLDPDDLEEWGCEAALALLLASSPGTTWVYLDGSAGALGYGSAATLFFPNGSRWVLCQTSPYQSSEGSEFWAAIMFLRWALASHPHLTFAVLGDNLHVITVLSPNTPPGLPSRSPAGTWESSLQSIQASLRPGMIQGWGWIKGHAGFVGNEISDAYSKWAAHVMVWDPSLLPPPPIGCISRGPLPVIHKLTTTSIKHLLPRHKHENIHAPSSFHFYNHTSWFKGLPFKWSSGNFNMAPFAFHDDLRPRHCHACPDPHPMDVISFVSHCPTCEHLVQSYIQCWRPPFTTVVSQWWSATTHVGERRNFVRGLVPMTLYTKLTTPPSGRRKPAHCHDLKLALKDRVPLLLSALYRTLEWLKDHPPPAPLTPPTGPNSWGRPWSPYSTSHTAQQRPPPAYHPPPPLPDKVAHKPPKRLRPPSPAAHTKARKHGRQPPRPVRPLSLKRGTASQPQPEPPPPKRPLTIRDMFNLPPPPRPAPPLATSAPISAPSPRITRYFAPAPPSPASTNSQSSSHSSNVSSL